jgi:ABC-2 type transport system ATP-binding protein
LISVQNLVKRYGEIRAVNGISFKTQPGEVVGLLGPNGAGKSTTLRALTGYLPPTEGQITLGGIDVQTDPLEARRHVGYLAENNPLYESLGVWECLELAAGFHNLPSQGLKDRLRSVVERCALSEEISKDVIQLSKGNRQRLGLALAMLHDPDILILDEPTSGLDPNQQRAVRELILTLKTKKTVLISTHILPEAEALCDRLLIIHQGLIVAQGTVAELQGGTLSQGETTYYVRFQGPSAEIHPILEGIPSLTRIEWADEIEPGCPGFHITSSSDPRQEFSRLSTEKRWPIMELRRKSASLEDIFRSTTGASL